MSSKLSRGLLIVALAALCAYPAAAATVRQMNLEEMVDNAGRIFRGTLLDVREGTVQAGGGELPTTIYVFRVEEAFKGTFQTVKGDQIAEVQMVGGKVDARQVGTVRRLPVLPDHPKLEKGQSYLLLTTAPSAVGLSTTVGLGQGSFTLIGKGGSAVAVNENHNAGLFAGMNTGFAAAPEEGPVAYSTLATLIRDIVGE